MSGPYYSGSRCTTRNSNPISSGFAPEAGNREQKRPSGRRFALSDVAANFFGFCDSVSHLNDNQRIIITSARRPVAELEIRPGQDVACDVSILFGEAARTVRHAIREYVKNGQSVELVRREVFGTIPYAVLRPVSSE